MDSQDINGLIQIYNSGGMGIFRAKQLIEILLEEREILKKEINKLKYDGNDDLWRNDGCPVY